MTTSTEAILATDCADLRRDLDAERVCNRNHLARIQRLNALLVTHERERDEREAQIIVLHARVARLEAELAELTKLYADRVHDLEFEHATRTAAEAELAEARAGIVAPPY
jgi:uncharacterized protein involved in exopolysaccharide biosynthesis